MDKRVLRTLLMIVILTWFELSVGDDGHEYRESAATVGQHVSGETN
jgi:hypothetical protein